MFTMVFNPTGDLCTQVVFLDLSGNGRIKHFNARVGQSLYKTLFIVTMPKYCFLLHVCNNHDFS